MESGQWIPNLTRKLPLPVFGKHEMGDDPMAHEIIQKKHILFTKDQ